ncbi:ATP-dependent DNA ligase [Candidatus Woesearchaeota archaeon]|nr:ATP-dependent DNA ligase [Candidatus Woesearchaeota archaeon]
MDYSVLAQVYSKLESTPKRLEKTEIISKLLKKTPNDLLEKVIYLLQGTVFPKWDERKIGMSSQSILKTINSSTGATIHAIEKEWATKGDLGTVVESIIKNKKQTTLFSKKLTVTKVFENLMKLSELEGKGTVSKKIQLVTELITSATPLEAKYIARTVIEDLRIGVQDGVLRDAVTWTYFPRIKGINSNQEKAKLVSSMAELKKLNLSNYEALEASSEELAREIYNYFISQIEESYNLTNDFSEVALAAKHNKLHTLKMHVGKPVNPMLAIKAESIEQALEAVGSPLQAEHKLDGFRLQIHKKGKEVKLFTRRLENVTKQFQEIIPIITSHVNADDFILDSELVGVDSKTDMYLSFQNISQRIKRKHHIEKTAEHIKVEINAFDIIYKDGKVLIDLTQEERRKILEKIVKEEKHKIVLTKKLITSDPKEIEEFYKKSLAKGNEGIMLKSLQSKYVPGRRVGGWLKHKPVKETLDLVITGAEWGEGKRAKFLSSFTLSCIDNGKFLEVGKVGTGFKEKDDELSFAELTKILRPKIISEKGKEVKLKPYLVLEINYEELQKSPTYNSGFALRFPRAIRVRLDKSIKNIETLKRIKYYHSQQKK